MNELDNTFAEIARIIEKARDNAYRKVNEELILMYEKVGQFLSENQKRQTTEINILIRFPIIFNVSFQASRALTVADSIE